jgi:hypothetical protein
MFYFSSYESRQNKYDFAKNMESLSSPSGYYGLSRLGMDLATKGNMDSTVSGKSHMITCFYALITIKVVSSNPTDGEVYSIQHYVIHLSVTCGRSVVFSTNKTDHHDIIEILLKVAFNTINQTNTINFYYSYSYSSNSCIKTRLVIILS